MITPNKEAAKRLGRQLRECKSSPTEITETILDAFPHYTLRTIAMAEAFKNAEERRNG